MAMKKLYSGTVGTGSGTLLYTIPTDFKVDLQDITIGNTTTAPISIKVHLVASGGSVADSNMFVPNVSIPGNTFIQWDGIQTLNPGDFIQGIASASGISISITGLEYRK